MGKVGGGDGDNEGLGQILLSPLKCSLGPHLGSVPLFFSPWILNCFPWTKAGAGWWKSWQGRGTLSGRSRRVEWWEVNTGPRAGEPGRGRRRWGNTNQMLAQGTVRKNTLAGDGSGALFKKGRKGWDRCLEKRKKEGKKEVGKKLD